MKIISSTSINGSASARFLNFHWSTQPTHHMTSSRDEIMWVWCMGNLEITHRAVSKAKLKLCLRFSSVSAFS